jgi:hypothetical protein
MKGKLAMEDETRQGRFEHLRDAAELDKLSAAERAEWAMMVQERCRDEESAVGEAARQAEGANAVLETRLKQVQAQNHELEALIREQEAYLTEVRATIGRM